MKNLYRTIILSSLTVACSSSPQRQPSSSENSNTLTTRDNITVSLPTLRDSKLLETIPNCPEDEAQRVDKDECRRPGEDELFRGIAESSLMFQSAQNPKTVKPSQRDFHPRQHACLAGRWKPLPNLSDKIALGAFNLKNPRKVILRYSNGSPRDPRGSGLTPPDSRPDGRGLAIKIVGLPGQSVLNYEGHEENIMNQDFILINDMSFFIKSPATYVQFIDGLRTGKPFIQLLDDTEKKVLFRTSRTIDDVVTETYFSQTPYVLGNNKVKYKVRQCKQEKPSSLTEAEKSNPLYLRERLAKRIEEKPICLIFSVQLRKHFMDVENPSIDWLESDSKFIDVAKIEIPKGQKINDSVRDSYCEDISFNPWNSLPENRPAGGINRARLAVYTGVSRKRRTENNVNILEPKKDDKFFDVLNDRN